MIAPSAPSLLLALGVIFLACGTKVMHNVRPRTVKVIFRGMYWPLKRAAGCILD